MRSISSAFFSLLIWFLWIGIFVSGADVWAASPSFSSSQAENFNFSSHPHLLGRTNFYSQALLAPENQAKSQLISSYCDLSLNRFPLLFTGDYAYWDSRESLFLLALCESWNPGSVSGEIIAEKFQPNFHKKLDVQQFSSLRGGKNVCQKPQTLECDVSRYAEKIFTALMDEIFLLKRASSLQVRDSQSFKDKESRLMHFFQTYFLGSKEVGKVTLTDVVSQKKFPQTFAMLDRDQHTMLKRLNRISLLKVPLSWFIVSDTVVLDQNFISFITNEYLQYSLFVDFYTRWLQLEHTRLKDYPRIQDQYLLELEVMHQQRKQLKQALITALRERQDFSTSYPLHVGFVRYQEMLLKVRNRASTLLPPFYALYEKLRNVQAPAS